GFKDDVFFVAVGVQTTKKLIELTAEKTMAADKKFTECWKAVEGENEQLAFYIDVTALVDCIEPLVAPPAPETAAETQEVSQLRKVIDALGIGKMTAVAGCTRIVDRGMYTKTRLFTPAPHKGLLMPLAGPPLTEADLACVPEDADFVGAIRLSPESLWAEIQQILRDIDPQVEADLLREVADIDNDLGISISDDLLANLGDTIVLSSAPSQGGFLTGTLLNISVKDANKLSTAVAKVEAYLKDKLAAPEGQPSETTIETTKAGRTEIHYLASTAGFPWPVAPAWAIHKDKLYLAGWPQVIATTIANGSASTPIIADADFRKVRARIAENASVLCYLNSPKIARQTYPSALVFWTLGANAMAGKIPVKAKPSWLPALSTLEKYLWPEILAVSANAQGITLESYGSLPISGATFMSLGSPLSAAALIPALHRARENAKRTVSASNLKTVGYAVFLYREDHDDQPPESLDDVASYLGSTDPFVSPLSGRKPPKLVDGKLIGEVDYILVKL
ncbi:MAG: hypothetical protein KAJ19_27505, partial [Gammaproteobacteria bacterium]|nr:hypothetical protein [Gammaproteobacteria bacterium]